MTDDEARKILGLELDEDPTPHLDNLHGARERIAEMVRTAPNSALEERYREGLLDFDKALAVLREQMDVAVVEVKEEEIVSEEKSEAEVVVEEEVDIERAIELPQKGKAVFVNENLVTDLSILPPLPGVMRNEAKKADRDSTAGISIRAACVFLIVVVILVAGGWVYLKEQENLKLEKQERMALLEKEGAEFVENRRWLEATEVYDEMEKLQPGSEKVQAGRSQVAAGIAEEQSQFVGYWLGELRAALDEGRWNDADKAGREILGKYPDVSEAKELLATVSQKKEEQEKRELFADVRKLLDERKFDDAEKSANVLLSKFPKDEETKLVMQEVSDAKAKAKIQRERALKLFGDAKARDRGEFDAQALEWLREAVSLSPEDKDVVALYEKMASYTRTVRVPEDFKTVQEALSSARDRDRIVIGEGVWEGAHLIDKALEIEGTAGKTILVCAADAGSVVTVAKGLQDVRLMGLTFRHTTLDPTEDRFSLVLVNGAKVDFSDCRFELGNGHGLTVSEGGHAKVMRSHFSENGWNGIAVIGDGSLLEAEGNTLRDNYHNGIESWDGAAVILKNNKCVINSRNGVHIDHGAGSATMTGNELLENQEFGIVLSRAGSGLVSGNVVRGNELGGIVIRAGSKDVEVKGNLLQSNKGVGLALEYGVSEGLYENNRFDKNRGGNFAKGVIFEAE